MVEHTVQDHLHSPLMGFCHKIGQKLIAGFQVFRIRHGGCIWSHGYYHYPRGQTFSAVVDDLAEMRVYGIVI